MLVVYLYRAQMPVQKVMVSVSTCVRLPNCYLKLRCCYWICWSFILSSSEFREFSKLMFYKICHSGRRRVLIGKRSRGSVSVRVDDDGDEKMS